MQENKLKATYYFSNLINDAENAKTKFQKVIEKALINHLKKKVGITPHEIIFSENKLNLLHYKPIVKKPLNIPLVLIFTLNNKPIHPGS